MIHLYIHIYILLKNYVDFTTYIYLIIFKFKDIQKKILYDELQNNILV